jgi:hypothetical protein
MLPKPESACLLIADISGYTGYLAGVELDHAQDILADLIDTIVGALRPPFHLSKLEGDAAFVYVATPEIDGSLLQDTIEATLFHVPPAAARHQAGIDLRMRRLPANPKP